METDQKFTVFDGRLTDFEAADYGAPVTDLVGDLRALRENLAGTRSRVDAARLTAGNVVQTYTGYNASLLKSADVLARYSPSGKIANASAAYATFLQSKERAGLERAAMSRAFSANQISAAQLATFMQLVTIQNLYLAIFEDMANPEQNAFYEERLQNSAMSDVERMRKTLTDRASQGDFGVDAVVSFETMTRKINLLKEVEDKLAADLQAMTGTALAHSTAGFYQIAVTGALALILSLIFLPLISRSVLNAISQALDMANAMAEGNLDATSTTTRKDEAGQLLTALSHAQAKLRLTLETSQKVAESVRTGSQGLIESNNALNDRTEQQAENLTRTAASMEEISTIVRKNADSAKEADKLVSDARERAETGGGVVKEAIGAMDQINESSSRIEAILGVINDISFQTNLLALNAAVEAARAGEHGKSFSIVANEVRNLAARSSAAAQEIEALIQDTSAKVAVGVELVNRSGKTLDEIVGSVTRISSLVSEIAVSSEEQSAGVDDIRSSVDKLETITQQNLQMVVQATQSTQSMGAEASELSQGLAFFTFSTDMNQIDQMAAPAPGVTPVPFRPAEAA